jgi:hypothetical protein
MEDFDIGYTASESEKRFVKTGIYSVEVKDIIKNIVPKGKFQGETQLEWIMTIIHGNMKKMQMRFTTLLGPTGEDGMSWTTDRVLKAIFPAIEAGMIPKKSELIGKKLDVHYEQKIQQDGTPSMFGQCKNATPYVEAGSMGHPQDFGPDMAEKDIPF